MKKILPLFFVFFSLLGFAQTKQDLMVVKPFNYKNNVGLELTGIPLNLYYERQLFANQKYSLHGLSGIYFPNIFLRRSFPGLSLGLNHRWQLYKKLCLFSTFKLDALNIGFPNYTITSIKKEQHYLSFNLLSANVSMGVSLAKGRWEFMLPAPCFMHSLITFHDGEDEAFDYGLLVSISTRVNYRFGCGIKK